MHDERSILPSSLPPTMLSAQVVESDAVAKREDTLEVHSSFFRKLKLDKDVAPKEVFKDKPLYPYEVEAVGSSCCACLEKPCDDRL